jgi:hypothetical protein
LTDIRDQGKPRRAWPAIWIDRDGGARVVQQADIDDGTRDGLTSSERAELTRVRRENRMLREECDILKRERRPSFARETR